MLAEFDNTYWASLPSIMQIHSGPVIDCDQRTVLNRRSIQLETQIDAADPQPDICATECCTIAGGLRFLLLENDESTSFFRSFLSVGPPPAFLHSPGNS
jgi:hypothetical protein